MQEEEDSCRVSDTQRFPNQYCGGRIAVTLERRSDFQNKAPSTVDRCGTTEHRPLPCAVACCSAATELMLRSSSSSVALILRVASLEERRDA